MTKKEALTHFRKLHQVSKLDHLDLVQTWYNYIEELYDDELITPIQFSMWINPFKRSTM